MAIQTWILNSPYSNQSHTTNSTEWQGRIHVALLSQSITDNSSVIEATFQWGRVRSTSFAINGTSTSYTIHRAEGPVSWHTKGSYSYSDMAAGVWYNIGTLRFTIAHGADGKKTQSLNAEWNQSGVNPNWVKVRGTFTLPTIARASSVSGGSGTINKTSTINITRSSSSFTHNLYYSYGTISEELIASNVATSHVWTLPDKLYNYIPNAQRGQGTIYCKTYNGGTHIGTSSTTFYADVDVNLCKPTGSMFYSDDNPTTVALTGNSTVSIKGHSNFSASISAEAKKGATIRKYLIYDDAGGKVESQAGTLYKMMGKTISFQVTDSRGITASTSYPVTRIEYSPPIIEEVIRFRPETSSSKIKVRVKGSFWNGDFGATRNQISAAYWLRVVGDTSWGSPNPITLTVTGNTFTSGDFQIGDNFDYNKDYEIWVDIQDKLNKYQFNDVLPGGLALITSGKKFFNINGELRQHGIPVALDSFHVKTAATTLPIQSNKLDVILPELDLSGGVYMATISYAQDQLDTIHNVVCILSHSVYRDSSGELVNHLDIQKLIDHNNIDVNVVWAQTEAKTMSLDGENRAVLQLNKESDFLSLKAVNVINMAKL